MFKFNDDEENLKCSFCGKDQDQVKKLVAVVVFIFVTNVLSYVLKSLKKN